MPKGIYSRAHIPPESYKRTVAPLEERFWAKVSPEPNSGCWLWLGFAMADGRGVIVVDGKRTYAPRVSLNIAGFPAPDESLHACHKCDVPNCVNPDHLFWGTAKDNMADMTAKGRHWRHSDKNQGHAT